MVTILGDFMAKVYRVAGLPFWDGLDHGGTYCGIVQDEPDLKHYGVKGMSWYANRWYDEDGNLTPAGKRRLGIGDGRHGNNFAYTDTGSNKSLTTGKATYSPSGIASGLKSTEFNSSSKPSKAAKLGMRADADRRRRVASDNFIRGQQEAAKYGAGLVNRPFYTLKLLGKGIVDSVKEDLKEDPLGTVKQGIKGAGSMAVNYAKANPDKVVSAVETAKDIYDAGGPVPYAMDAVEKKLPEAISRAADFMREYRDNERAEAEREQKIREFNPIGSATEYYTPDEIGKLMLAGWNPREIDDIYSKGVTHEDLELYTNPFLRKDETPDRINAAYSTYLASRYNPFHADPIYKESHGSELPELSTTTAEPDSSPNYNKPIESYDNAPWWFITPHMDRNNVWQTLQRSSDGRFGNFINNIPNSVGNWVGGAVNDVGNWVGGAVNDVGNWVGGAVSNVGNWVSNPSNWSESVGRISNNVKSSVDWTGVANNVGDLANRAVTNFNNWASEPVSEKEQPPWYIAGAGPDFIWRFGRHQGWW